MEVWPGAPGLRCWRIAKRRFSLRTNKQRPQPRQTRVMVDSLSVYYWITTYLPFHHLSSIMRIL